MGRPLLHRPALSGALRRALGSQGKLLGGGTAGSTFHGKVRSLEPDPPTVGTHLLEQQQEEVFGEQESQGNILACCQRGWGASDCS